jgi:hypothetical protein
MNSEGNEPGLQSAPSHGGRVNGAGINPENNPAYFQPGLDPAMMARFRLDAIVASSDALSGENA